MARTIALSENAVKVLRRECNREIENASQERSLFMRKADSADEAEERDEEVVKQEANLLAAADLYGALSWHGVGSKRGYVFLTDAAELWLEKVHAESLRHLDHLAENPEEGDYDYVTQEAYLADVVGRILRSTRTDAEVTV